MNCDLITPPPPVQLLIGPRTQTLVLVASLGYSRPEFLLSLNISFDAIKQCNVLTLQCITVSLSPIYLELPCSLKGFIIIHRWVNYILSPPNNTHLNDDILGHMFFNIPVVIHRSGADRTE